jgi:hypothetical protein
VHRKKLTELDKLTSYGFEANITPAAEPQTRARNNSYILNLTDSAKLSAVDLGTIAVLILQKNEWQQAVINGTTPPVNPLSPVEYQELLYELINMAQYVEKRPVLTYLNIVTPVNGVINLPNPPGRFITFAQAQAENLPMSNPLPTVNGYTAKLTDYYHILAVPFQVPQKGDKGDTGDTGDKGDTGLTGATGESGAPGAPGAPGAAGQSGAPGAPGAPGPIGANGPTGATGAVGATGPIGPTGARGTPSNPQEAPTGSGIAGAALAGDKYVELAACITFINFPYGSNTIDFQNSNQRTALINAITTTGKFDSTLEDVISAQVGIQGLSDVGLSALGVNLGELLGNNRDLTITDASNRKQAVYYSVEERGIAGVTANQRHYSQAAMNLKMLPPTGPITIDGRLNLLYPNSNPPTSKDAAMVKFEVCSFVKRYKACVRDLPYTENTAELIANVSCWGHAVARANDIWDNNLNTGLDRGSLLASGAAGTITVSGSWELPNTSTGNTMQVSVGYNVNGVHSFNQVRVIKPSTVFGATNFSIPVTVPANDGVYDINIYRLANAYNWTLIYSVTVAKS